MRETPAKQQRSWKFKFRCALRGAKRGIRGQSSFFVHFFMTAAVLLAGKVLDVNMLEWCVLLMCIGVVLTAEMFNSALESLSARVESKYHVDIRDALDIGSAAVLTASVMATVVGSVIFMHRLGVLLEWWRA